MRSFAFASGLFAFVTLVVTAPGCSGDGNPAPSDGTGGTGTTTGGTGTTTGGTGTTTGGTGTTTGGTGTTTGGTGTTTGGTGTTTGGTGTTTGGTGSGGTGTGGLPACTTQVSMGACTSGDPNTPDCAKPCGINNTGVETFTCNGAMFIRSACTFPQDADYSCYKLPMPTPACPAGTTTASMMNSCTEAACMPCGDPVGIAYTDSQGATKSGFCVCDGGRWKCGSVKEYPCYPQAGAPLPASCM